MRTSNRSYVDSAMAVESREYALQDSLAAIIDYRGKTPPKSTPGIPLVTAKIVKNGRIAAPTEFIELDIYDSWMRRGIPEPATWS